MSSQPKTCADCGAELGRRNTTGLCRRDAAARAMSSPEMRAKVSLGRRRRFQADPEFREREAARLQTVRSMRVGVGGNLVEGKLWEIGNAVRPPGSPSRMRAGAKTRARRAINAGCPPHLVEDYYFLTRRKGLCAADAIAAVQQQDEANLRRWRRAVGAPAPIDERLQQGIAEDDSPTISSMRPGDDLLFPRPCRQANADDVNGSPTFSGRSA